MQDYLWSVFNSVVLLLLLNEMLSVLLPPVCSLIKSLRHRGFVSKQQEVDRFVSVPAPNNQITVSQHLIFPPQPAAMRLHNSLLADCVLKIESPVTFLTHFFYLPDSDMAPSTTLTTYTNATEGECCERTHLASNL